MGGQPGAELQHAKFFCAVFQVFESALIKKQVFSPPIENVWFKVIRLISNACLTGMTSQCPGALAEKRKGHPQVAFFISLYFYFINSIEIQMHSGGRILAV